MNDKKLIISIVVVTISLIIGGAVLASRLDRNSISGSDVVMNENVKVMTNETYHDWGEIGLNDGNVEKEFEIINEGEEVLKLTNITTSCMCTTAQLIKDDEESPLFGMHTKSDYVMDLEKGESAKLKVVFDPAFHGPSGVGPITRQIKVTTNDADKGDMTFTLSAMVRK